MCSCFSKYEDQFSVAMMQKRNENFGDSFDYFETIKTVVKPYAHKAECSVQEALYHNLAEPNL